ncbi:thioredoxin family protein [Echinicola sp. 20G]|uniref:thioredoxin family protein n=1 Tax=Echinicola sp. 20G TaxID=2781961 RepID=UPI0019109D7A|nr:thioredoxin family protein [Echinicola sp. 20G]
MQHSKTLFILLIMFFLGKDVLAQESIQWLSFEQLDDSLSKQPKKVFIDFYTDWCTYCKKMDRKVFTKPEVIQKINSEFYAVRMDAESRDTIQFDRHVFFNRQATDKRAGIHDLAMLLGQRNGTFAPPTMIVLDNDFKVLDRRFEYLYSQKLMEWLSNFE